MRNGSITVYLSLSLLLCIGVIFTVLESARMEGLKAQMVMGAESALDSVFAEYDRAMFDKYGITLFNGGEGGIQIKETMEEYLGYEYNPWKDRIFSGTTFYPLKKAEVIPQTIIRAVDFKGSIFAQLVVEFMKYNAVGDQTDRILEQLNILKKGETAREDVEDAREEAQSTDWGGDGEAERTTAAEGQAANTSLIQTTLQHEEGGDGGQAGDEDSENTESGFHQGKYEEALEDSVVYDVEEIKKGGFMKLVLPRGSALSGEKIEKEDLPSEHIPDGEMLDYQNGVDDMGRDLLYNVYLTEYFPSFTNGEKRSGVQYELEYILFGKESDDKNLKAAVNRLLLIREGLNILHIVKSPEKMEAALSMATVLMGWTLIPALVTLTQAALVGAWAYGESIMDVRALLGGGKISLIKNNEEWNLSLEGVAALLKGTVTEGKEGENGLSYNDYLLLLLFMENKEEKYYRTMDMVQINIRKSEPSFRMEECVFGVQMGISVEAGRIFSRFIQMPWAIGGPYEYYFSVSRMY